MIVDVSPAEYRAIATSRFYASGGELAADDLPAGLENDAVPAEDEDEDKKKKKHGKSDKSDEKKKKKKKHHKDDEDEDEEDEEEVPEDTGTEMPDQGGSAAGAPPMSPQDLAALMGGASAPQMDPAMMAQMQGGGMPPQGGGAPMPPGPMQGYPGPGDYIPDQQGGGAPMPPQGGPVPAAAYGGQMVYDQWGNPLGYI